MLSFITLFAKSIIDCAITYGFFSQGTPFVPTWNIIWSGYEFIASRKLSHVNLLFVVKIFCYFPALYMFYNTISQDKPFLILLFLGTSFLVWFHFVLFSKSLILFVLSTIISVVLYNITSAKFLFTVKTSPDWTKQ